MLLLLLSTPLHQRAASKVQHPNHVAASSLSPQVARKGSTLSGFVQRSRLEREVGRDLHSNKWEEVRSCIRQSGQSGEGCRGSPMEKIYETRSGDLFVRILFPLTTNLPSHQHKLQTPLINNSLTRSHTLQTKQIGRLTNKFINYLKLHLY